jgi:hypothetical protein
MDAKIFYGVIVMGCTILPGSEFSRRGGEGRCLLPNLVDDRIAVN